MNKKSFKVFILSLVTVLFGSVAVRSTAQAGDSNGNLEVYTSFSSIQEEGFRSASCGQVENTPVVCIEPFRDCNRAYEKLIRNAKTVCEQTAGCRVDYDSNVAIFPPGSSYSTLIAVPVSLFKKGDEVNIINNCRANPPPVNQADQAKQDKYNEEFRRAEQGLPALDPNDPRVRAIRQEFGLVDPVVDPAAVPAPAQDPAAAPVDNNNAANISPAGNADNGRTSGGCSVQITASGATGLQSGLAALLFLLPFIARSVKGRI